MVKGRNIPIKKKKKIRQEFNPFKIFEIGKKNEFDYFEETVYEGEFKNGLRNGKGKEYNNFGEIIYEGEYLNGQRNGKGIEYNEFGEIIYEGEFSKGKIE